jgi:hypothetical protein
MRVQIDLLAGWPPHRRDPRDAFRPAPTPAIAAHPKKICHTRIGKVSPMHL